MNSPRGAESLALIVATKVGNTKMNTRATNTQDIIILYGGTHALSIIKMGTRATSARISSFCMMAHKPFVYFSPAFQIWRSKLFPHTAHGEENFCLNSGTSQNRHPRINIKERILAQVSGPLQDKDGAIPEIRFYRNFGLGSPGQPWEY
jgi:hypothetical protein